MKTQDKTERVHTYHFFWSNQWDADIKLFLVNPLWNQLYNWIDFIADMYFNYIFIWLFDLSLEVGASNDLTMLIHGFPKKCKVGNIDIWVSFWKFKTLRN